jgi:hypothetical protein
MQGQFWANTQYFNPRQIGGLRLWLDATDPAANGTQPANNSAVSTWVDKSTGGNNVTQGTGANQPTYKTVILNSKPVVRFNGSTTLLQKASGTDLGDQITVFVVGTTNGNSIHRGTFFDYTDGAATNTGTNIVQTDATHLTYRTFDGALKDATWTGFTEPFTGVIYGYNDGSNNFIYINGTQQGTAVCGNISGNPTYYTIGSLLNGVGGWYLDGDVAEVLVYNSALSSAKRTLINRYLGNKWGISVA